MEKNSTIENSKEFETDCDCMDGAFWLCYKDDGVYLRVQPAKDGGKAIDKLKMIETIKRKRIDHPRLDIISALITATTPAEEKIAEAQEEFIIDEEMSVELSEDHMQAFLTLLPPDEHGQKLAPEEIERLLKEHYHITYGIDPEGLETVCSERPYGKKTLIASGTPPQAGQDGSVTYYFATKDQSGELLSDETGKVDFRNISKFERVSEGQVLVRREFAAVGEDGTNVLGKRLAASKGKEAPFPKPGKNVRLSEDRRELKSLINGKASIKAGKVFVLPHIKIDGDIDMSVGNVDFDGDIVISGNVNPGFTVTGTGDVLVAGSFEAASIQAAGNVTIQGGVKGADRGKITAGGSVSAPFIERTVITSGENVTTGMLVNCHVTCEGYIDVSQGRGTLVGGSTSAGQYVVARTIGSDAGVPTKVLIGALAQKRQRAAEVEKMLAGLDSNIGRLELALKKQAPEAHEKAKLDLMVASLKLKAEKTKLLEEKETLEKEILAAKAGTVHVLGTIYKGVKLYFGKEAYTVPYDNKYVTYFREQKEILTESCRYVRKEK
ncbi:DUF342 domain-containing protein [Christensenella intestinihominis]|uniref:DUF342 domain-containing protein n=1 Tax=Christensenella intestinihominis TaxID=1851429 RepID=UPI00082DB725|nr:FapA family protein [Christensenella intestinihominis]